MKTDNRNWWKPDLYLKHLDKRKARSLIFKTIRSFFDTKDFLEVDTPALQISPGLEVHLKAFMWHRCSLCQSQRQQTYK